MQRLTDIILDGLEGRKVKTIPTNQAFKDGSKGGTPKAGLVGENRTQTTRSFDQLRIPGVIGYQANYTAVTPPKFARQEWNLAPSNRYTPTVNRQAWELNIDPVRYPGANVTNQTVNPSLKDISLSINTKQIYQGAKPIDGNIGISYKAQKDAATGITQLEHITPVVLSKSQAVKEAYPNLAKLEKIGYKRTDIKNEAGEVTGYSLTPKILNPNEWEHEELFPDKAARATVQAQLQDYITKRGVTKIDDKVRTDLEDIVGNHFRTNQVSNEPVSGTGYAMGTGTYNLGLPYSREATNLSNLILGYDNAKQTKIKEYVNNAINRSTKQSNGNIQIGIGDYTRDEARDLILKEARAYAKNEGVKLEGTEAEQQQKALSYVNDTFFNIPEQKEWEKQRGVLPEQSRVKGGINNAYVVRTDGVDEVKEGMFMPQFEEAVEQAAYRGYKDNEARNNPVLYRLINKKTGESKLITPSNYNKGYFFSNEEKKAKGYGKDFDLNTSVTSDLSGDRKEWDIKKQSQSQVGVGAGISASSKYHLYEVDESGNLGSEPFKVAYGSELEAMPVNPDRNGETVFYDYTEQEGEGKRASFTKKRKELLPVLVDESDQYPLLIDAPIASYESYEDVRKKQKLPTNQNPQELIRKSKQASFDLIGDEDNIYHSSEPVRQQFIKSLMTAENNERSVPTERGAMLRFEGDYLEKPDDTYLAWRQYNDGFIQGSRNQNALSKKRSDEVKNLVTTIANQTRNWETGESTPGAKALLRNGIDSQDAQQQKAARDYLKQAINHNLNVTALNGDKRLTGFLSKVGASDIDDAVEILGRQVQGALAGYMRIGADGQGQVRLALDNPDEVYKEYKSKKNKRLDAVAQEYYQKNLGQLVGMTQPYITAKTFWAEANKPGVKRMLDTDLGEGWEKSDYLPDVLRTTNPNNPITDSTVGTSLNDATSNLLDRQKQEGKVLAIFNTRYDGFGVPRQIETGSANPTDIGLPKEYGQKTTEIRPLTFDEVVSRIKAAKYMEENPLDERVRQVFELETKVKPKEKETEEQARKRVSQENLSQIYTHYKSIGFDDEIASNLAIQAKKRWDAGQTVGVDVWGKNTSRADFGRGKLRLGTEWSNEGNEIFEAITNPENLKERTINNTRVALAHKQIEENFSKVAASSEEEYQRYKDTDAATKMTWHFLDRVKADEDFSNPSLATLARQIAMATDEKGKPIGIKPYLDPNGQSFNNLKQALVDVVASGINPDSAPVTDYKTGKRSKVTRNITKEVGDAVDGLRSRAMADMGLTEEWIADGKNQQALIKRVLKYHDSLNPKTNAAIQQAARKQGTERISEYNTLQDMGKAVTPNQFLVDVNRYDITQALGSKSREEAESWFSDSETNSNTPITSEGTNRVDTASTDDNLYDVNEDGIGLDDGDDLEAFHDALAIKNNEIGRYNPETIAIKGHDNLQSLANDNDISVQGLSTNISRQINEVGEYDEEQTRRVAKQNNIYNRAEFFNQNRGIRQDKRYQELVKSLAQLKQIDGFSEDDVLKVIDPARYHVEITKGMKRDEDPVKYERALQTYRSLYPNDNQKQLRDKLPKLSEKEKIIYQQALSDANMWSLAQEDAEAFRQSITPEARKLLTTIYLNAAKGTEVGDSSLNRLSMWGSEGTKLGEEGYYVDDPDWSRLDESRKNELFQMADRIFPTTASASVQLPSGTQYTAGQGYHSSLKRALINKTKTAGQGLAEGQAKAIGRINAEAVAKGWGQDRVNREMAKIKAKYDAQTADLGEDINLPSYQVLAKSVAQGISTGEISRSDYHDFVQRTLADIGKPDGMKESDIRDFFSAVQDHVRSSSLSFTTPTNTQDFIRNTSNLSLDNRSFTDIDIGEYMDGKADGFNESAEVVREGKKEARRRRIHEIAGNKVKAYFNKEGIDDSFSAYERSTDLTGQPIKGFSNLFSNMSTEEKQRVIIHTGNDIDIEGLEPTRKQLGIMKENLWALKEKLGMTNPQLGRNQYLELKAELEDALTKDDGIRVSQIYDQLHHPNYRGRDGMRRMRTELEANPIYQELKVIPTMGTAIDNERMGLAPDKSYNIDNQHPYLDSNSAFGEIYQQPWAKDTRDFPFQTDKYTVPSTFSPMSLDLVPLAKLETPGQKVNLSLAEIEDTVDNYIRDALNMGRSDAELREKAGLSNKDIHKLRAKQQGLGEAGKKEIEEIAANPEQAKEELLRGILLKDVEENPDITPVDDFLGRAFVKDDTGALRPLTPEAGFRLGGQELANDTTGIKYQLDENGRPIQTKAIASVKEAVNVSGADNPDALYLAQSASDTAYKKAKGLFDETGLSIPNDKRFSQLPIREKAKEMMDRAYSHYQDELNRLTQLKEQTVVSANTRHDTGMDLERASEGIKQTTKNIGEIQKKIEEVKARMAGLGDTSAKATDMTNLARYRQQLAKEISDIETIASRKPGHEEERLAELKQEYNKVVNQIQSYSAPSSLSSSIPNTRQYLNNQLSSLQSEMAKQIEMIEGYRKTVNLSYQRPVSELTTDIDKQIADVQSRLAQLDGIKSRLASANAFANINKQLYEFNDYQLPENVASRQLSQMVIPQEVMREIESPFVRQEVTKPNVKGSGVSSSSEVSDNMVMVDSKSGKVQTPKSLVEVIIDDNQKSVTPSSSTSLSTPNPSSQEEVITGRIKDEDIQQKFEEELSELPSRLNTDSDYSWGNPDKLGQELLEDLRPWNEFVNSTDYGKVDAGEEADKAGGIAEQIAERFSYKALNGAYIHKSWKSPEETYRTLNTIRDILIATGFDKVARLERFDEFKINKILNAINKDISQFDPAKPSTPHLQKIVDDYSVKMGGWAYPDDEYEDDALFSHLYSPSSQSPQPKVDTSTGNVGGGISSPEMREEIDKLMHNPFSTNEYDAKEFGHYNEAVSRYNRLLQSNAFFKESLPHLSPRERQIAEHIIKEQDEVIPLYKGYMDMHHSNDFSKPFEGRDIGQLGKEIDARMGALSVHLFDNFYRLPEGREFESYREGSTLKPGQQIKDLNDLEQALTHEYLKADGNGTETGTITANEARRTRYFSEYLTPNDSVEEIARKKQLFERAQAVNKIVRHRGGGGIPFWAGHEPQWVDTIVNNMNIALDPNSSPSLKQQAIDLANTYIGWIKNQQDPATEQLTRYSYPDEKHFEWYDDFISTPPKSITSQSVAIPSTGNQSVQSPQVQQPMQSSRPTTSVSQDVLSDPNLRLDGQPYSQDMASERWAEKLRSDVLSDVKAEPRKAAAIFEGAKNNVLTTTVTKENLVQKLQSFDRLKVMALGILDNKDQVQQMDIPIKELRSLIGNLDDMVQSLAEGDIARANKTIKTIRKNVESGKGFTAQSHEPFSKEFFDHNANAGKMISSKQKVTQPNQSASTTPKKVVQPQNLAQTEIPPTNSTQHEVDMSMGKMTPEEIANHPTTPGIQNHNVTLFFGNPDTENSKQVFNIAESLKKPMMSVSLENLDAANTDEMVNGLTDMMKQFGSINLLADSQTKYTPEQMAKIEAVYNRLQQLQKEYLNEVSTNSHDPSINLSEILDPNPQPSSLSNTVVDNTPRALPPASAPQPTPSSSIAPSIPPSTGTTPIPWYKNRGVQIGAGVGAGAIGLAFLNNYLAQKREEEKRQQQRDRLRQMTGG